MAVACLTFNPALDLTGRLDQLAPGHLNLVDHSNLRPGGKGVNVALVLRDLGVNVTVSGLLGADNQKPFWNLFAKRSIRDEFVRLPGATRINVKVAEQDGRVTDLNFPGLTVSPANQRLLMDRIQSLIGQHQIFVLSGSLPAGMPVETYKDLIRKLKQAGKTVIFDSSGSAFAHGVLGGPDFVKPNLNELGMWAGERLDTEQKRAHYAGKLLRLGVKNVLLSCGSEGVTWFNSEFALRARPAPINVVSTVGAGDAMVAGICYGLLQQWSAEESLRFATALASVAVSQIGVDLSDEALIHALAEETELTRIMP